MILLTRLYRSVRAFFFPPWIQVTPTQKVRMPRLQALRTVWKHEGAMQRMREWRAKHDESEVELEELP